MTVRVWIDGEREIESVTQADESRHRVERRHPRRLRQGVRIPGKEQQPLDVVRLA
jgi:hypothetical protein